MRFSRTLLSAALPCLALAACVPAPEPTPAPARAPAAAPASAPAPIAAPSPVPSYTSWMDVPATPGDWSYAAGTAWFGDPASGARLSLRCDWSAGAIEIGRAGQAAGPVEMVIRSEFAERGITAAPARSDPSTIVAQVPARDPLLDAMAFSKGRFAVEVAGVPTIYVPAWPEVTRVIEDCR